MKRRKIFIVLRKIFIVLTVFGLVAVAGTITAFFTGCCIPIHRNYVRFSSDFRAIGRDDQDRDQIRERLLSVTPRGSSRQQVETFIRENFKRGIRSVSTTNLGVANVAVTVDALISENMSFPFGSWYKDAVWLFDYEDTLIDVQVREWNVFM